MMISIGLPFEAKGAAGLMARFEARTATGPGRTTVTLVGECDLTVSDDLVSALLAAVRSSPLVVVDLSELGFLDSSGVHSLITAYRAARDLNRRLYVVGPRGMVATVLDVTGVGTLLSPPAGSGGAVVGL